MKKDYRPPQKVLERYANVLVNFALGRGKGIRRGDVVYLIVNEYAKPLYAEIRKAVIKSGGHIITDYRPDTDEEFNFEKEFLTLADDHQISFFPDKYMRGLVDQADHMIFIISETDKHALKGVDPKRIMQKGLAMKPYMDWRREKENQGKFSWTAALYGTPGMAKEARMDLEEYWEQIIKACFLDNAKPIQTWQKVSSQIDIYVNKLDKLQIQDVHITGPDADLTIKIGEKRRWIAGGGANIPSFEIFTSPDWRGTNGWIRFNQPLYRYGNLITGIELEFKNGLVVKAKAKQNEKVLKHMIAAGNANKVGEFSMTDKRFSHITKFMAETLYDENIGGPNGNTHIALGAAYHECFSGDLLKVKKQELEKLGFNDSSVHTDIISTAPREITATLKNGNKKVIYRKGQFTI
jgi:aminopeptidase